MAEMNKTTTGSADEEFLNSMSASEAECKCAGGEITNGRCVLPKVTFSAFIMSLNTAALYHLGEISDTVSGNQKKDLVLAKHSIDTLNVLKEKTRGNLTAEEQGLLDQMLYELQLRFVKAQ